jgi:hypothetical protein
MYEYWKKALSCLCSKAILASLNHSLHVVKRCSSVQQSYINFPQCYPIHSAILALYVVSHPNPRRPFFIIILA